MRVVSIVPSVTETLLAWGITPVAVTRFCEQGDAFPTVGGTKDPDIEKIAGFRPDLVVVCDQENRRPDADALRERGLNIHVVTITDIAHVGPQMVALAKALDLDPALGEACAPSARIPTAPKQRKRAYIPIWKRPWMTLNEQTYGTSLLASIGIDTIATGDPDRYPEMDLNRAATHQTDLVIAPNEPYVFGERHRAELETVAPTIFVDGKDLFWWGVRTPGALARLDAALHNHIE